MLFRGHAEVGIVHTKRGEQALAQKGLKGLARHLLDQIADNVGRDRIVPRLAGRELQRDIGQGPHHALEVAGQIDAADFALSIGGVDRGAILKSVGQARGVA